MEAGYVPVGNGAGAAGAAAGTKVIRAPGLKRGKFEEAITDRIKLETVLGITVSSNAALDCDPNAELVAYPAGCTVVLYNTRKNRQHHMVSPSRKTITCVAFSSDGRYLATGECGHTPCVRVWDLQDPSSGGSGGVQVAEFPGHKFGVNCVAFSISSKYLVSIGSQHDMIVNVWDWKANLKLASNKVSSKVRAVSFAENGSHFVTVGNRHVKFWYLEYSRSAKYKEPVPLMGRSAILGEQRNNDFCDVACGRGEGADNTYAITKSGLLCEFNNRRLLKQWVELRTTSANCMSVGSQFIFIGCADGLVRCFSPLTLMYVTTLPRPHYLGVDISLGMNITHMFNVPPNARYPDAIALTYDERNHKLSCVYNDHSFYVWDVKDIMRIGKSNSALYHSACIWGVEMLPPDGSSLMPPGSFLTCSSDDTVRVWNLSQGVVQAADNDTIYKGNIYSNELLKVMYVDPDLTYLKDVDLTATNDKEKPVSYDGKNGVRCIRISPCGQHIAHGDRAGNVRVSCAKTARSIVLLEAHDAEVLCLEYSPITASGPRFLASASRDRLIHLFNVDEGYKFVQTLDDHSSSITSVRFLITNNNLQMVSCGADKTILFRELVVMPDGSGTFSRAHVVSGKSTLYDMEVEGTSTGARHVLAACQDRCVRVYSAQHAKHTKTFRASTADDGSLIKVALDSSGIYVATSCTDKTLCVYDYYSGECMATMYGHSELVTGLRFTLDCQYLISASGDGCVFVWRVPHDMVVTMRARLAQQAIRQGRKPPISTGISGVDGDENEYAIGSPPRRPNNAIYEDEIAKQNAALVEMPDYRLSIGRLPSWAQKSLDVLPASGNDSMLSTSTNPTSASEDAPIVPPRGKWAKRLQTQSGGDYTGLGERRVDSDGSKDSSLDSGTDTRLYGDRPRESSSQITAKQTVGRSVKISGLGETRSRHHTDDSSLGSFKFEDLESTEHDGDVEDISDGERTSSDHNTNRTIMYYPGNSIDNTPGEFTVNAMDVEELRQSQRRLKKAKTGLSIAGDGNLSPKPRPINLPIISVSGTSVSGSGQDSEEDDDEVSTPSGDNADKNPLSGSCESIDTLGMRERFLKSAYDSLSGAEMDGHHGNTSISAQHHLTSNIRTNGPFTKPAKPKQSGPSAFKIPTRDSAPVAAPRSTSLSTSSKVRNDDTSRKREELNRRIEETRRQLESVGYRSGLKSSQSTMDLSYTPEKDHNTRTNPVPRQRPLSMAIHNNNRIYGPASGKTNTSSNKTSNLPPPRQQQRHGGKFGTNMTRSSSVGVLNQSDSESDPSTVVRSGSSQSGRAGGLMRPTISSQNKVAPGVNRRRGLQTAYSSVNLSTVGQEDSSSEAESATGLTTVTVTGKPAIPPRPRAVSIDHTAHNNIRRASATSRSGSDRDLSAKAREVTARLTSTSTAQSNRARLPDNSRNDSQLSQQLCQQLAEQLTRTAGKVVHLYRKLSVTPNDGSSVANTGDSNTMLTGLEQAIAETQKMLRAVTSSQLYASQTKGRTNGGMAMDEPISLSSTSGTDGETADNGRSIGQPRSMTMGNAADKLEELVLKGIPNTNGNAMVMMDQYSDILLNMMQQNIISGTTNQNGNEDR